MNSAPAAIHVRYMTLPQLQSATTAFSWKKLFRLLTIDDSYEPLENVGADFHSASVLRIRIFQHTNEARHLIQNPSDSYRIHNS